MASVLRIRVLGEASYLVGEVAKEGRVDKLN